MIQINHTAPIRSSHQIEINAPAEIVWQLLTDIGRWPQWQRDISMANLEGKLLEGNFFVWKSGPSRLRSKIHTVTSNERIGWTGKFMGITAIHNWSLQGRDEKTILTTQESMHGILARLMKGQLQKKVDTSLKDWLAYLKVEAEKHS